MIKGNIRDIKNSFPKERVLLGTDRPVQGIEQINGVVKVNKHEHLYEIHISKLDAAQSILQQAMQQATVHRFEIMEPTLNEIFIKAVGGEHIE